MVSKKQKELYELLIDCQDLKSRTDDFIHNIEAYGSNDCFPLQTKFNNCLKRAKTAYPKDEVLQELVGLTGKYSGDILELSTNVDTLLSHIVAEDLKKKLENLEKECSELKGKGK